MRSEAGRWVIWALAVLVTLAGGWVLCDLTVHHTKVPGLVKAQPATQPAESLLSQACTSFEWADCDEVAQSDWAVFPFGSPRPWIRTSTAGLAFFTAILCWLVMIGWPSPSRAWLQMFPLLAAGFGVGMSIFLEFVMWTRLPKACPLCIVAHLATLLLFVLLILLWPRASRLPPAPAETSNPEGPGASLEPAGATQPAAAICERPWPSWWTLAVTPLVTAGVVYVVVMLGEGMALAKATHAARAGAKQEAMVKRSDLEALKQYYEKRLLRFMGSARHGQVAWELAPRTEIPIQGRPVKGPANARRTVVIFSDFECPACKRFEDRFRAEIAPLFNPPASGGVRVVFKHFPISKQCNPHAVRDLHPIACEAAYAAEAAYVVGGDEAFWKMHDLLFEKQAEWKGTRDYLPYARAIGLDEQAFKEAMASDRVKEAIKADIEHGHNMGMELVESGRLKAEEREWIFVNSTPTIYLDGKFFGSAYYPGPWRRILGVTGTPMTMPAGPAMRQPSPPGLPGPRITQPTTRPAIAPAQ